MNNESINRTAIILAIMVFIMAVIWLYIFNTIFGINIFESPHLFFPFLAFVCVVAVYSFAVGLFYKFFALWLDCDEEIEIEV